MYKCTIAITRYDEPDYILINLLTTLSQQERIQAEILILDQCFDIYAKQKISTLCWNLSNSNVHFRYISVSFLSLSHARNFALLEAKENKVLFIDCDAEPSSNWAYWLVAELQRPNTAIVWSRIKVVWLAPVYNFFNHPLIKIPFFSEFNLFVSRKKVSKIIWASFGLDKIKLPNYFFDVSLWYAPWRSTWWEETDFCSRVACSGQDIVYVGDVYVLHCILPKKTTYLSLIKIIYHAGILRQRQGGLPTPHLKFSKSIFPFNPIVYLFLTLYFVWYGFSFMARKFQSLKRLFWAR